MVAVEHHARRAIKSCAVGPSADARSSCGAPAAPRPHAAGGARIAAAAVACGLLAVAGMATKTDRPSEGWTVPLHVVMWTTLMVGFIMVFVVFLMH